MVSARWFCNGSAHAITPQILLVQYDAWEPRTDKYEYQWKLRLLQSVWRADNSLPMKKDGARARGAELPMPDAERALANFLTPTIRQAVRWEVLDPARSRGKLYGKPRIFNHLLSSQPLAFNLFAELREDLALASRTFAQMTSGRVSEVTAIDFEWSPGRGDERYTADRSAFDVYVRYRDAGGRSGFLGIEVKYHENLESRKDEYRRRYDEVASEMGCFRPGGLPRLRQPGPLQQMWRDHLLVGAHKRVDQFNDAIFIFLYPEVNTACATAAGAYRKCLSDHRTYDAWTLDTLTACLMSHTDAAWVQQFYARYLDLDRLLLIGLEN